MTSDFGTVRSRTSRPTGTIIAPPTPWTIRASDELPERAGKAAENRTQREDDDRRAEDRARAESVRRPAARRDEDRQRKQIGGQRQFE